MIDWKKAYSTYLFAAIGVAGAALLAVQSLTESGLPVPAWVLPVVGAFGIFLRALPQDGGKDE